MSERPIAIIGGGITGLTAAYELTKLGRHPIVFEAAATVGGKLLATPFAGATAVDEGADAMLARVPWGIDLATELGLPLVAPAAATALVAWKGRLHCLPDGLMLGVPTGLAGLATSRLISVPGKLRAWRSNPCCRAPDTTTISVG